MSNRTSTWLPIYGDIFTNKKFAAAAKTLARGDVHKMVGHLTALWVFCMEFAQDGDLGHLSDRAIAQAAGWPKTPSKFVATLLEVGLLDPDRRIHDWDGYAGPLIDKRKRDAERKRAKREEERVRPLDRPQDIPSDSPRDVRTYSDRTVPHRTGELIVADTDSSGQVSDVAASRGTTARGVRGSRLSEAQVREAFERLEQNPEWPLQQGETWAVLETLANDPDLPDGNLDEALAFYNDLLETSPLEAKTVKSVTKAMRPWLASWLRRDHLRKLMARGDAPERERAREALTNSVLGTDQCSEMSNSDVEDAIGMLEGRI